MCNIYRLSLRIVAAWFLCLAVLPDAPINALTLAQIRTEARVLALDNGTTRNRFSDARILQFINEAQRSAILESKAFIRASTFDLVSGTTYYDLPSDFFQMYRLSSDYQTLPEITPEALDKSSNWAESTGEPTHYFMNWSSRTKVGFYPFPNSTSSTTTIRYDYMATVPDLSGDSDVPFNSITEMLPYGYAIAYFAAARMTAIDGRLDLSTLYRAEFSAIVAKMAQEARARPSYRPSAVGARP
jgi:hypothetical protein